MAVFYKYVERQVSDQINWADISKSMSQTFDAERDAREKKKAEIDQASLEYVEKLQSQPETESANLNSRMSQFITDASSLQKSNLDDLKQGRITLRDYTLRTQNLKSDSVAALDSIQTYGKRYSEVMKGIKDGDLSAAQADFMARFEGFANLANNRLYVEPTTGRVFVANEVIDPVTGVKKMGDNIQNMASLKNMMEQDIPRMNLDADLNTRAKALGGFINEEIKRGKFYSTAEGIKFEDATKQQYYDKYLKDLTEELAGGASNPNTVSFFVDNMKVAPNGQPYKVVFSEGDRKNPNDLLMKQGAGGVYFAEPTKEQMKDAEEHIKIQMRQKIKQSTEIDMINLPQPPQPKSDGDGKGPKTDDKNIANQILLIKYGTREEKMSAFASLEGLKSMEGKKFKIDANNNVFIVDTKDPNKASQPVSMNISDYDFVNAFAGATGITDAKKGYNAAIQGGRFKDLSPQFLGALESQKKDVDYTQQFRNYALPVLNNIRLSGPEEKIVPKLQESEFAKWGYEFEETGNGDFVKITAPPAKDLTTGAIIDGDSKTITISLSNPKTYKQAIFDFIKMNPPSMYDLGTLRSLMDARPNASTPPTNNSTVVPGANSR